MKAIIVTEHGGPEVLAGAEAATPTPGAGEVLVDVSAAGVNYIDVYHRTGLYPIAPPFTPGLEGAGTVAELGEGVTEYAVGDQVAWSHVPGSYASQVVAPVSVLLPVPTDVPPMVAAAVLLQGLTAEYLSSSTHPVVEGDEVLIHAGAGGVGLLLTQLVKRRGGRVIATVSTDDKAELSKEAGADEVIGYEGFADRVRELTGGRGVDVVYDGVGKATFEGGLASLRPRGLMALFGQASGPVPPMDPQTLAKHGSLYLTRPIGAHYLGLKEFRRRADGLFSLISSGELSVRIGGEYDLDRARRAHEDLEARRTTGKLLLVP